MKLDSLLRRNQVILALVMAMVGMSLVNAGLSPTIIEFSGADENPIVLSPGESGDWDAVSVRFPNVIFHDGMYHLFYGTFQDRETPVAIGYASSEDGLEWNKFENNPILEADGEGFDAFGVTRPVVYLQEDGTWVMYYNGLSEQGQIFGNAIGRATAPSPTGPWTRLDEPVLESGGVRDWDNGFIFPDSLVETDAGLALYYSSVRRMGMATSEDGINWTKYNDPTTTGSINANSDPILIPMRGAWDSYIAWAGYVRETDDGFEMFYYGTRGNDDPTSIGYAYSENGINWTRYENNPILSPVGRGNVFFPSVVVDQEGTYLLFYAVIPAPGAFTEFGLARGTIDRSE